MKLELRTSIQIIKKRIFLLRVIKLSSIILINFSKHLIAQIIGGLLMDLMGDSVKYF